METASSTGRRRRGPAAATPWGTAAELAFGAFMLGTAALGGLIFVHRPWPNRLDAWGYRALPAASHSEWARDFAKLGSLRVLVIGVIVVFVIGLFRDWIRAVACAVAPVIAVLIVQDLAKPLVDRHIGLSGVSSYPSGTVAAVAALSTAVTLVMPTLLRPLIALLGAVATVGVCAAVIVLRWHYPTDTLGGIGVGVGAVLVVDAVMHLPWVIAAAFRRARSNHRVAVRRSPQLA
jgi:membrane-associated phospholipid phosphatase